MQPALFTAMFSQGHRCDVDDSGFCTLTFSVFECGVLACFNDSGSTSPLMKVAAHTNITSNCGHGFLSTYSLRLCVVWKFQEYKASLWVKLTGYIL